MSFKFDFEIDSEDESLNASTAPCVEDHDGSPSPHCVQVTDCKSDAVFLPAGEILIEATEYQSSKKHSDNCFNQKRESILLGNGRKIICVSPSDVKQEMKHDHNDEISSSIIESDLIPHVYEGGRKIWDGSLDLLRFIFEESILFDGLKVLELGCGVGLPGLYALIEGSTVHFQDYNEDVIRQLTIPTILLNSPSQSQCLSNHARFFSGDWASVMQLLLDDGIERDPKLKYDVILTSETIYSLESYKKLHDIMRAVLKPSGVIYLAAKTFYFGVGGGTREFQKFVCDKAVFDSIVVKKLEHDGVYREVLKLTFLPDASTALKGT